MFYTTNCSQNLCGLVYHLAADQNLEETRKKKSIFPTTTKRTISGHSNRIGT
jgi:hypothetical protein